MNPLFKGLAALVIGLLSLLLATSALAHGDKDEEKLAEFQNHLDDYEQDVRNMLVTVAAITSNPDATKSDVDVLIEQWEDVALHEAIEDKATIAYPGVWQSIIQLQQAVVAGEGVAAAGETVKAALWQGMGAVRMAASMVGQLQPVDTVDEAPLSGPESVARIIGELTEAVALYDAGELDAAQRVIHDTYEDRFEYLEGDLIPRDPELVTALEADFNATLPLQMKSGAAIEDVRTTLAAIVAKLERASEILEQVESDRTAVF